MTNKVLSIIIPSYNMENYLPKCIESLLIPEIDKLDILVINDGSNDKTSKIAHEYELRYPTSIRVIDKENGNYGSCINRGIKEARGKYVKVLDADDTFETHNFAIFVDYITDMNADCIITDFDEIGIDNSIIRKVQFAELPSFTQLLLSDVSDILLKKMSMHAITYRTTILNNISYSQTEGISYTDVEWIFTPVAYSKVFEYVPLTIYKYLIGREGQTIDPKISNKRLNDTIIGIRKQTSTLSKIYNQLNPCQKGFLKRKLAKRILRNYSLILRDTTQENLLQLKELYISDNVAWRSFGINLEELTKIPLLGKSYIEEWTKNNYSIPQIYKSIYRIYIRLSNLFIRLFKLQKYGIFRI